MRLGIASSLRHDSPAQWAEKLAELGCRAAPFPLDSTAPDALIDAYCEAAAKHDILIAEVGVWRNALTDEAAVEYSIRQLRLADRVGARCCVNVAGAAGPDWDGGYRENFSRETWDRTVRTIQRIIDEARPTRTDFSLEPMPWMIPTGPEEYLRLMEDVNRERFKVHLDIINMINCPERYFFPEQFIDHCFDLLGGRIRSCHLKDIHLRPELTFQLQERPCGEGEFPLGHYLRRIHETDPDMPVIIEHLREDEEYVASFRYVSGLWAQAQGQAR